MRVQMEEVWEKVEVEGEREHHVTYMITILITGIALFILSILYYTAKGLSLGEYLDLYGTVSDCSIMLLILMSLLGWHLVQAVNTATDFKEAMERGEAYTCSVVDVIHKKEKDGTGWLKRSKKQRKHDYYFLDVAYEDKEEIKKIEAGPYTKDPSFSLYNNEKCMVYLYQDKVFLKGLYYIHSRLHINQQQLSICQRVIWKKVTSKDIKSEEERQQILAESEQLCHEKSKNLLTLPHTLVVLSSGEEKEVLTELHINMLDEVGLEENLFTEYKKLVSELVEKNTNVNDGELVFIIRTEVEKLIHHYHPEIRVSKVLTMFL